MPEQTSPRLALPQLQPAQAQKHVTVNEALARLDILVQMRVEALGETTPPASPAEGAAWGLGTGATGAWAGQDGSIAAFVSGGWIFFSPAAGWRVWDAGESALKIWNGTAWALPEAERDNLDGIGIAVSR